MRVDIWSDVVCPWCYLGTRRFEEAVARLEGRELEVVHRAFELDPTVPAEGMAWPSTWPASSAGRSGWP